MGLMIPVGEKREPRFSNRLEKVRFALFLTGRKYDGLGNLCDWWEPSDVETFKSKTVLMAEQVDMYKFIDPDGNVHRMNSELTMGENLADLGGINLALSGMTNYLKNQNILLTSDADLLKSLQRVFFKSWANIWKQNSKLDASINLLSVDPHAPTDFRGNLVANNDAFYEAFGITDGKMWIPMDKRVKVW